MTPYGHRRERDDGGLAEALKPVLALGRRRRGDLGADQQALRSTTPGATPVETLGRSSDGRA